MDGAAGTNPAGGPSGAPNNVAKPAGSPPDDIYAPSLKIPAPDKRPLLAFAYDPSRGQRLGNRMTVEIKYEKLSPGPIGSRFAVIDYDGGEQAYYAPVDLDNPSILIRGGLEPSEVDPRFHQQMVYAVASETLERFEAALGRRVHWRIPRDQSGKAIPGHNRLYLHPHALSQANAFYSADAHGILFGYFRASKDDPGRNLPGQTVFTCLSHDIIAHETTHAIVDGIRPYFMEPTNVDVPAFHEAFADLAALFRHFSHRETLLDTMQKTGGRLYTRYLEKATAPFGASADKDKQTQADFAEDNPLVALATQFGEATGMHGALRSALGMPPDAKAIASEMEPHSRGSILVAAVFDAFFTVYMRRAAPLLRVFRAGGGRTDDLPQGLADLLAREASRTAETFFTLCARALDYCPPLDLSFGDFLRALITADRDFYPDDTDGIRDALMEGFRLRGIVADDAASYSEASLCWPELDPERLTIPGLVFGDPNGLTHDEKNVNGEKLRDWVAAHRGRLGFREDETVDVPSFHPTFRVAQDGTLKIEMIVELIQTHKDDGIGGIPLRSGVTLIVAKPAVSVGVRGAPYVRFAIRKGMDKAAESRARASIATSPTVKGPDGSPRINFALIHGGM